MAGLDRLAELRRKFLMDRQQRSAQAPAQGAALAGQGIDALARYQQQMAAQNQAKALAQSKAAQDLERQRHNQAVEAQAAAAMAQQKQLADAKAKALADKAASDAAAATLPGQLATGIDAHLAAGMTPDQSRALLLQTETSPADVERGFQEKASRDRDATEQELADKLIKAQTDRANYRKPTRGRRPPTPEEIRRQELKDRKLEADTALAEKNLDLKDRPSEKQATELTQMQAAAKTLDELMDKVDKVDPGPLSNIISIGKDMVGMAQREGVTEFKQQIMFDLVEKISKIAGANVQDSELQRILEAMPSFRDNDETFKKRAGNTIKLMNRNIEARKAGLKAAGKNISGFAGAPVTAGKGPIAGPRRQFIRAQLEAAKARGVTGEDLREYAKELKRSTENSSDEEMRERLEAFGG